MFSQNPWFRKSRFKGGKGKKLNIGGGGLGYRERPGLGAESSVSYSLLLCKPAFVSLRLFGVFEESSERRERLRFYRNAAAAAACCLLPVASRATANQPLGHWETACLR